MDTSQPTVTRPRRPRARTATLVGLSAPLAVAVGSWALQWFARFPPGSRAAGLTALGFLVGLVASAIPAAILLVRIVRDRHARRWPSYALLAVCTIAAALGVLMLSMLVLDR